MILTICLWQFEVRWLSRLRAGLHAREEAQDQEVRWLEGVDRNVVQVFVFIYHVAANHGAKLSDRDAQLLGGLCFRVLPFAWSAGYLHAHNCIVEGRRAWSNQQLPYLGSGIA